MQTAFPPILLIHTSNFDLCYGAKNYHFLSEFCCALVSREKTDTQATQRVTIPRNHFAPNKLVVAERCRLENCTQSEGECHVLRRSDFELLSTHLNEALRNRFVCGLRSEEEQKKLFTEEHAFEEAVKIAFGREAAKKGCCCVHSSWLSFCEQARHGISSNLSYLKGPQGSWQTRQV